ncbi:MAG: hypothetical protein E7426_05150 [Ruminococcaceae bacterium]|nr:hypothetical protein [Oscillospiraceae bacterium]
MKKWELARYLIDAKKCVDSILYISNHADQLRYYDLRELIDGKRNTFYINCCAVIDKTIVSKKINKHTLCEEDPIVDLLYLERDKNSAHKDDAYIPQSFDKIEAIAFQMKEQIIHIRELCKDHLPKEITLDFVPHDKALFRAVHKLLADDEEKILNEKHPLRKTMVPQGENTKSFTILHDLLDLRTVPEEARKDYCVVFNNGINLYEGIQERQDGAIKANLLHGKNMWCSVSKENLEEYQELERLGVFDDFSIPQPLPKDPILANIIMKKLNKQKSVK